MKMNFWEFLDNNIWLVFLLVMFFLAVVGELLEKVVARL